MGPLIRFHFKKITQEKGIGWGESLGEGSGGEGRGGGGHALDPLKRFHLKDAAGARNRLGRELGRRRRGGGGGEGRGGGAGGHALEPSKKISLQKKRLCTSKE